MPLVKPFADALGGLAKSVRGPLIDFFHFIGDHQTIFGSLAAGVLAIVAGMKLWALGTAAVTAAQAILNAVYGREPDRHHRAGLAGLAAGFAYAGRPARRSGTPSRVSGTR